MPEVPHFVALCLAHYLLWTPCWTEPLPMVLRIREAWGWTPQSSPYPVGREELPTVAAACNGRGDPPAARWPGKERVKRHLARAKPSLLFPHLYLPTSKPGALVSSDSYQHEVLVPLQLLHSPGQPLPLLLPGRILQTPEFLVPLLFSGGFALDLA